MDSKLEEAATAQQIDIDVGILKDVCQASYSHPLPLTLRISHKDFKS